MVPYLGTFHGLWDIPELSESADAVRSTVITALLWNIWKMRNSVVFNTVYQPMRLTIFAVASDLELWKHRVRRSTLVDALLQWSLIFSNIVT